MASQSPSLDTYSAQEFQESFDETHFEINQGFEKLRHILLHLVKTTGKMAAYCEAMEHENRAADPSALIDEVTPDLLIHALQLANYYQTDLGQKYNERIAFLAKRKQDAIGKKD